MSNDPVHKNASNGPGKDRRGRPRSTDSRWNTAITRIEPNTISIRGYGVDELMGRLSFEEGIYLLLRGELPTPSIGRMFGAVLVSSLDHGVTPPSTLAARNVSTSGAPLRDCVAAGVLGFGRHHGGDIETCMRFLESGLALVRGGATYAEAGERILADCPGTPPGFGHRFHTRDPRATRLFQMARELELDSGHVRMIESVERILDGRAAGSTEPLPMNVDGAIAAIAGDLGFEPELGSALFIISRVPGLIAHACEEASRYRPMRQIDPKDHVYDGPEERRVPETRK
jgi:citrate synthase